MKISRWKDTLITDTDASCLQISSTVKQVLLSFPNYSLGFLSGLVSWHIALEKYAYAEISITANGPKHIQKDCCWKILDGRAMQWVLLDLQDIVNQKGYGPLPRDFQNPIMNFKL
jgi:hypothetical protein